jgi:hypothetical protein
MPGRVGGVSPVAKKMSEAQRDRDMMLRHG